MQEQVYIESFLIKVRQFFFQIFLYIYFLSNKKKVRIKINILEKQHYIQKLKYFSLMHPLNERYALVVARTGLSFIVYMRKKANLEKKLTDQCL